MTDPGPTLPDSALRRLAELRPNAVNPIFTSDLSVNEFLLVREAGFRPLGLVLGSSIYHVGIQTGRWSRTGARDAVAGDVPRPRAGDDADGGRGRRSRAPTASSASGWRSSSRSSATTWPSSSPSAPR